MDRDRVESWCQKGMLGVVVASLWFAAIAFGGVDLWARVVLQWLMVLGLVFFAVRLAVARRPKLVLPPAFWAATLFMAYAVGRYWYADVEYVARQELIRVAICCLVFAMVTTSLSGQRSVKVLVYAMIFLATLEAAYGIYQWSAKPGTVLGTPQHAQYIARGSGTLFNPNHLAGLIGLVLPVSITLAVMSREPHWLRILVVYCAGVQAVGLVATMSRGGIISVAVSLFLLGCFLIWRMRHRVLVACLFAGILCSLFFVAPLREAFAQRFQTSRVNAEVIDTRELIWKVAVAVWREEPWFGAGPDHFDIKFRPHRDQWLTSRPRRVHNDYLQLLTDWGVIGAALGGLFCGATLFGFFRVWPRLRREESTFDPAPSSTREGCVVGSGVGLIFLGVHSFFEFNLFLPGCAASAAVALGVVAGSYRYVSSGTESSIGGFGRVFALSMMTAAAGMLATISWRGSAESHWLQRAAGEKFGEEENENFLRRASLAESGNPETWLLLGESLRFRSFVGSEGHRDLAIRSIECYRKASALNRSDPWPLAREAMCLAWLGRDGEATRLIEMAWSLDPNNKALTSLRGWVFFQLKSWGNARLWINRSWEMPGEVDPLAALILPALEREEDRTRRGQ